MTAKKKKKQHCGSSKTATSFVAQNCWSSQCISINGRKNNFGRCTPLLIWSETPFYHVGQILSLQMGQFKLDQTGLHLSGTSFWLTEETLLYQQSCVNADHFNNRNRRQMLRCTCHASQACVMGGGWKKCRKLILLCLFWHVLQKNNPKTTWWPPRPLVSFQKVGWARSSSEKDKTSHWSLKIISEWRFCRISALWCSLSGKAVCTGTAARTIFISCSPKVEWPPELWQSRTNPVFPQKGFEDKLVFWEHLLS